MRWQKYICNNDFTAPLLNTWQRRVRKFVITEVFLSIFLAVIACPNVISPVGFMLQLALSLRTCYAKYFAVREYMYITLCLTCQSLARAWHNWRQRTSFTHKSLDQDGGVVTIHNLILLNIILFYRRLNSIGSDNSMVWYHTGAKSLSKSMLI